MTLTLPHWLLVLAWWAEAIGASIVTLALLIRTFSTIKGESPMERGVQTAIALIHVPAAIIVLWLARGAL